jgi:hypothetical protein
MSARQLFGINRAGLTGRTSGNLQLDCDGQVFPEDRIAGMIESLKTGKQSHLTVVLGNPWVRYTLTPPLRAWLNSRESEALARQIFIESHGEAARQWAVRHQHQGHDAPMFATAIEQSILDSIQKTAARFGIKHVRIMPMLAIAWNHARTKARRLPWFALAEPSQLTLVHQQDGVWRSLASHSTAGEMTSGFNLLLDREATRTEERNLGGAGVNLTTSRPAVASWTWLGKQGQDACFFWAAEAAK